MILVSPQVSPALIVVLDRLAVCNSLASNLAVDGFKENSTSKPTNFERKSEIHVSRHEGL